MDACALVARNLRRLRVGQGLSQEALALEAGVDRTYVSRLERGLENPTVSVLERLARSLRAGIVEFFTVPVPGQKPPANLSPGRRPTRIRRVRSKA
jgi:transcriptional regulator with XRE-family HTH domain